MYNCYNKRCNTEWIHGIREARQSSSAEVANGGNSSVVRREGEAIFGLQDSKIELASVPEANRTTSGLV